MNDTQYSRRLDSTGRLVIPKKLRDSLGLTPGTEYTFYTHSFEGKTYLCVECGDSAIEQAKKLLEAEGYSVKSVPAQAPGPN